MLSYCQVDPEQLVNCLWPTTMNTVISPPSATREWQTAGTLLPTING